MSGLEQAALVAGIVWLGVLSLVVILMVRQVALMTVRLSVVAPHTPADDAGPAIGTRIRETVADLITGSAPGNSATLLVLGATCGACRSFAERLSPRELSAETVTIVAGEASLAASVAELLPRSAPRLLGEDADRIVSELSLDTVPFGFRIEDGVIRAKGFLTFPSDVDRLNHVPSRLATGGTDGNGSGHVTQLGVKQVEVKER